MDILSPWEIWNQQQVRVQDTETRQEPISEKEVGSRGRLQNLGPDKTPFAELPKYKMTQ